MGKSRAKQALESVRHAGSGAAAVCGAGVTVPGRSAIARIRDHLSVFPPTDAHESPGRRNMSVEGQVALPVGWAAGQRVLVRQILSRLCETVKPRASETGTTTNHPFGCWPFWFCRHLERVSSEQKTMGERRKNGDNCNSIIKKI